jgi:hypothetical protein
MIFFETWNSVEDVPECTGKRIESARWKSSSGFGLNSVTESHCILVIKEVDRNWR